MNQRSSWTAENMPRQDGRVAVVTGANAGLGLETTRALAAAGATVVLACRNLAKAEAAAAELRAQAASADGATRGAEISLEVRELDLSDLGSVERFADGLAAAHPRVDLLVNNAGLMAVDPSLTADGFETQIGVNHLGHFALTARVLPLLLETPGSRVVSMSSMGHRPGRIVPSRFTTLAGYDRWRAYFASKLANLLFAFELDRRLRAAGAVTASLGAHPGGSATDLGFEGSGWGNAVARQFGLRLTQPAALGALPMLRALTDPGAEGGQFYGPRWIVQGRTAVLERPARRAHDEATAAHLWTESARLTGVEPLVPAHT